MKLVGTVTEAFRARRYRLIEAAAGAVAEAVLSTYPQARGIQVTVHKPHAPIAATFQDVGVIIKRSRPRRNEGGMEAEAFIALGGNVGDVRSTFDQAIALLCDGRAVRLKARSSDYRTPPWGVTNQPPFINAVIAVVTSLSHRKNCWRVPKNATRLAAIARGSGDGARAQSTSISSPTTMWRLTMPI